MRVLSWSEAGYNGNYQNNFNNVGRVRYFQYETGNLFCLLINTCAMRLIICTRLCVIVTVVEGVD